MTYSTSLAEHLGRVTLLTDGRIFPRENPSLRSGASWMFYFTELMFPGDLVC